MLVTLAWSYGAVARRLITGRRVPGILQLAVVALTVRTIVGVIAGSFLYFLQPVATTLVLGIVFLVSLRSERPIVARLASDFCPLRPEITRRPAIARLFSGLTLLWAGVHIVSAVTTFALLVSLSTPSFYTLKSIVSLAVTIAAIAATITWSIRTARAENLDLRVISTHDHMTSQLVDVMLTDAMPTHDVADHRQTVPHRTPAAQTSGIPTENATRADPSARS